MTIHWEELAKNNSKERKRINYLLVAYEELTRKEGEIQLLEESAPPSHQEGKDLFIGR